MQKMQLRTDKLVPGGQVLADFQLPDGQVKKVFVWGALPDEEVIVRVSKKRAGIFEAVTEEVLKASKQRVAPLDVTSYLSTSPWQIFAWDFEMAQKAQLVQQIFAQSKLKISLPKIINDGQVYAYRNKMEFTWWWNKEFDHLDLAHYRRGTKGKIAIDRSSLARPEINRAAVAVRDLLRRLGVEARQLKTLLLRSSQDQKVLAQLYVSDRNLRLQSVDIATLPLAGLEVIYSNPKSPASVISERLQVFGQSGLTDTILGRQFKYPTESFFQINLPVYELALKQVQAALLPDLSIVDLYSGVGTIGLSVAAERALTLVEIDPAAVAEMRANIKTLALSQAVAVLAAAETALGYIKSDLQVIVDPPRAGLHTDVIERILQVTPKRIVYLSCNPVTQARDIALLSTKYQISDLKVFNFFPRTPHIESLAILDLL